MSASSSSAAPKDGIDDVYRRGEKPLLRTSSEALEKLEFEPDPIDSLVSAYQDSGKFARLLDDDCIEAAKRVLGDPLDWARLEERLRDAGVSTRGIASLKKAAKAKRGAALQAVSGARPVLLATVKSRMPDLEIRDDLLLPPGYTVRREGLFRVQEEDQDLLVSPYMVWVDSIEHDVTEGRGDGPMTLAISWWTPGGNRCAHILRKRAANARTLNEDLSARGFPIDDSNAAAVSRFLTEFQTANAGRIPESATTQQMGFHAGGFVWGHHFIKPDGTVSMRAESPTGTSGCVAFRGADHGDEDLALAMHHAGTFEGWVEAAQLASNFPKARLAVYLGTATLFQRLVGVPNFVVEFAGSTSLGKTTALRIVASSAGCPDETLGSSLLQTWDGTPTSRERAAVVCNGIPLTIDDTSSSRHKQGIPQTIYAISSGRGRGRGSKEGLQRTRSFNTILVSSGETPCTSFSGDGGSRARTILLWNSPFGAASEHVARTVNAINLGVKQNYGHALPRVVEALLQQDHESLRESYRSLHGQYLQLAGDNPVASRLAASIALLDFAAEFTHETLALPWLFVAPARALWNDIMSEAREADRATEALRFAWAWAASSDADFWGRHATIGIAEEPRRPAGGWSGRWDAGDDWEFIGFVPSTLRRKLAENGFDAESTLRTWRDRNWLKVDGPERLTKKCRVQQETIPLIAVGRKAIEEIDRSGDASAPTPCPF